MKNGNLLGLDEIITDIIKSLRPMEYNGLNRLLLSILE